jgi:hypothetical protein
MRGIHITRLFISENPKDRDKFRKAQVCGRWCKYQRSGCPLQALGLVQDQYLVHKLHYHVIMTIFH